MYRKLLFVGCLLPLGALAQNVGIGTRTPASRLHVVDSLNNVQLRIESTPLGSEAQVRLQASSNPFSFLELVKYSQGTTGSLSGVPKDNLSAIFTGGNAGPLLLNTGDGISPLLFAAGPSEQMRITAAGRVGIGTTNPALANTLHVHSNDPTTGSDVSIGITNNLTTDAIGRGARFRMNAFDLAIINNEPTGRLTLSTNFNQRLVITPAGNIGINNLNPTYLLDIAQTGDNGRGVNVAVANGFTNTAGIMAFNPNNVSSPGNFAVGIHGISGSGAFPLAPSNHFGIIGECRNTAAGAGVLGIGHAPSPAVLQGAITGINLGNGAANYGVLGFSNGTSGAGTVGVTDNATAGLLGYAQVASSGPAIKSTALSGSAQIGLELENGALKVSGAKRTVFRHTATAANTVSNETVIPNTTFANNANDLLIVTPFWDGVYVNAPIGIYFDAGSWRIFRQDLLPMPLNAKFNVLVVKQ